MSTREIEQVIAAWRSGDRNSEFGIPLTTEQALELRDGGNVPDADDRSLRLVLFVGSEPLERKRLRFEPDYHDAPTWKREGSRPVNIVPLTTEETPSGEDRPWWDLPRVKELEEEWQRSGAVAGVEVPGEYRSFVFKTIVALQDAGRPVTPDSVGASIERWLTPDDAERVRMSLKEKEPDP